MNKNDQLISMVKEHYPEVQAIYLFGTYGTRDERADSDVDLAILMPPVRAKETGSLVISGLRSDLESALNRDVDLINLRRVPTVLQMQVIAADRRIDCADEFSAAEFEMLTISYYQKLNQERAPIIEDALESGRFIV